MTHEEANQEFPTLRLQVLQRLAQEWAKAYTAIEEILLARARARQAFDYALISIIDPTAPPEELQAYRAWVFAGESCAHVALELLDVERPGSDGRWAWFTETQDTWLGNEFVVPETGVSILNPDRISGSVSPHPQIKGDPDPLGGTPIPPVESGGKPSISNDLAPGHHQPSTSAPALPSAQALAQAQEPETRGPAVEAKGPSLDGWGTEELRLVRSLRQSFEPEAGDRGDASAYALERQGPEIWALRWAGQRVGGLRGRGFGCLAELLRRPGQRVDINLLLQSDSAFSDPTAGEAVVADANQLNNDGLPGPDRLRVTVGRLSRQEVLDAEAIAGLRQELKALVAEREEALDAGDLQEEARITTEIEALEEYVLQATGAKIRRGSKSFADPSSKRRKALGQALANAIAKVEQAIPEAGLHLRKALVGVHSSQPIYSPDEPIPWSIKQKEF